jgi:hypothetical protein
MNQPRKKSLNQYNFDLQQLYGFTEAEVSANEAGDFTDIQRVELEKRVTLAKRDLFPMPLLAAIVGKISANPTVSKFDSLENLQLQRAEGVLEFLSPAFWIWQITRHLEPLIWTAEYRRLISSRRNSKGIPVCKFQLGKHAFLLSHRLREYFAEGGIYRLHYIQYMSKILLSAELVDMP